MMVKLQAESHNDADQGLVVQSIVSLPKSSRHQIIKYMLTTLSNTQLFFVGKILTFFQQK